MVEKVIGIVGGLLLISFGFMILLYAMPGLNTITDTTQPNNSWVNASSPVKGAMGVTNSIIVLFPFLFFFTGMALIVSSIRG
jgi:hypothetical protein